MRASVYRMGALAAIAAVSLIVLFGDFLSPSLLAPEPVLQELMQMPSIDVDQESGTGQAFTAPDFLSVRPSGELAEWPVGQDGPDRLVEPAWSLMVGERQQSQERALKLAADLQQRGFRPYLRRHHMQDGLYFGVYLGPWLTLERLRQTQNAIEKAKGVKYHPIVAVRYTPPSVLVEPDRK